MMSHMLKNVLHLHVLHWQEYLATSLGIFGGIGTIAFITYVCGMPLLIASFGASAVLIYAATNSPLAQPRNVIGGHLIAAFVGATCYSLMGETWYSITLGVTLAIIFMMMTDTLHPPGGATAIVTILSHGGYSFVIFPVMIGVVILLISAVLASKLSPYRAYPHSIVVISKKQAKTRFVQHTKIM